MFFQNLTVVIELEDGIFTDRFPLRLAIFWWKSQLLTRKQKILCPKHANLYPPKSVQKLDPFLAIFGPKSPIHSRPTRLGEIFEKIFEIFFFPKILPKCLKYTRNDFFEVFSEKNFFPDFEKISIFVPPKKRQSVLCHGRSAGPRDLGKGKTLWKMLWKIMFFHNLRVVIELEGGIFTDRFPLWVAIVWWNSQLQTRSQFFSQIFTYFN